MEDPEYFVINDEAAEGSFLFVINLEDGSKHRTGELEDESKYTKVNDELQEKLEVYQETVE